MDPTEIKLSPIFKYLAAEPPTVDGTKLCVTTILSTPAVDRDGDIVRPLGGDLSQHRRNPVVFFNHGTMGLPIGRAEDNAGNYTVVASDEGLTGTTFFSENEPNSLAVFQLIDDKILRGASIGFRPLKDGVIPIIDAGNGRYKGNDFRLWELIEYSHVGVPANPDALAVRIGKGFDPRVDRRLIESLQAVAAKSSVWSPGWAAPTTIESPKPEATMRDDEPESTLEVKVAAVTPEPAAVPLGPPAPEVERMPLGAKCLRNIIKHCEDHLPFLDNPQVSKFYQRTMKSAHACGVAVYPKVDFGSLSAEFDYSDEQDGAEKTLRLKEVALVNSLNSAATMLKDKLFQLTGRRD